MNVYFSGIGGVAIGPLSEIAEGAGYSVQGSDEKPGRMTKHLESRGIPVFVGSQDGNFLRICHARKRIDWFIHTSALPHDHPELRTARELGIRTAKRDELLSKIITDKKLKLIAIAGTHGKTTTTGMLVWALKQLGVPVSYSVGTTLSFGPSGLFDPKSEYFVYECDEFDRNFLHFSPFVSLITSIDYDHPDTYPTKDAYLAAFRQFADQSKTNIMWRNDGKKINATAEDGWILGENEVVNIKLAGAHNRRNATLVMKALEYLALPGSSFAANKAAIESFPGTDRRFERLADNLYSDYGHHPAEIAATLQMARELSGHVVLAYQPHQNTRQYEIKHDYKDVFTGAEKVYWLPTYLSREDPDLPILTPEELAVGVSNRHAVQPAELNDELWSVLNAARESGKLVLLMGAGSIDAWAREKLAA